MSRITLRPFLTITGYRGRIDCPCAIGCVRTERHGPYHVSQTFHVGGEGGWDYLTVDPEHKLLYVPRTTHTMVLDAATGKTVADIPGQKRNHGVAIVPSAGRGFITDGEDASVTVFDLKTYAVLGKVKAADDADGVIYDPASGKVLGGLRRRRRAGSDLARRGSQDRQGRRGGRAWRQARVSRRRRPGQGVHQPRGQGPGRGGGHQDDEGRQQMARPPPAAHRSACRWIRAHRRLFIGCRKPQKLIVMNADDGKVLADLPIGAGVDATQFDGGDAFASCGDGTLAVARETAPGKFEIVQTVATPRGARTMGLDPTTHTLYLPTAEFGPPVEGQRRPPAKPGTFMIVVVSPTGK